MGLGGVINLYERVRCKKTADVGQTVPSPLYTCAGALERGCIPVRLPVYGWRTPPDK